MWLLLISLNGKRSLVVVNGQTGMVAFDAQGNEQAESRHSAVVMSYKKAYVHDAPTFTIREPRLGPSQETDRWPPLNSWLMN